MAGQPSGARFHVEPVAVEQCHELRAVLDEALGEDDAEVVVGHKVPVCTSPVDDLH